MHVAQGVFFVYLTRGDVIARIELLLPWHGKCAKKQVR